MRNADFRKLWDRLYRELMESEREHIRIQDEMNRILADTASGIPLSDGQYRCMNAGRRRRAR
jgi:hypothetical protein